MAEGLPYFAVNTLTVLMYVNMGIGMTCAVSADKANEAVDILGGHGIKAYCIGEIVKGGEGIELI